MRRLLIPVSVVGALLLAAGVCVAYADRSADLSAGGTALLVAGTVLCLGAVVAMVVLERRPEGLVVPEGMRLPAPHWMAPLALTGACDLAGGLWSSLPLSIIGIVLLAAAAVGEGLALQVPPPTPDRATVDAARRLVAFGRRHAVSPEAPLRAREAAPLGTLEHVGMGATRIVVVAADGAYGDVMLRGHDRAMLAASLAGLDLRAPDDRALGAAVRTGPYEWRRMAGSQLSGGEAGR